MTEDELRDEIARLANVIDAPKRLVPPVQSETIEDELVVMVNDGQINVVYQERGTVSEYISTRNPDEALYWIFREVIRSMRAGEAIGAEHAGLDKRRYWFKRDRELMAKFGNFGWTEKLETELTDVLSKAPFRDK